MASDYALKAMIERYERQAREQQALHNDSKNKAVITTDPNKKQELLKEAGLYRKQAIDAQAKATELKKHLKQREEKQLEKERFTTKREAAEKVTKEVVQSSREEAKKREIEKMQEMQRILQQQKTL